MQCLCCKFASVSVPATLSLHLPQSPLPLASHIIEPLSVILSPAQSCCHPTGLASYVCHGKYVIRVFTMFADARFRYIKGTLSLHPPQPALPLASHIIEPSIILLPAQYCCHPTSLASYVCHGKYVIRVFTIFADARFRYIKGTLSLHPPQPALPLASHIIEPSVILLPAQYCCHPTSLASYVCHGKYVIRVFTIFADARFRYIKGTLSLHLPQPPLPLASHIIEPLSVILSPAQSCCHPTGPASYVCHGRYVCNTSIH